MNRLWAHRPRPNSNRPETSTPASTHPDEPTFQFSDDSVQWLLRFSRLSIISSKSRSSIPLFDVQGPRDGLYHPSNFQAILSTPSFQTICSSHLTELSTHANFAICASTTRRIRPILKSQVRATVLYHVPQFQTFSSTHSDATHPPSQLPKLCSQIKLRFLRTNHWANPFAFRHTTSSHSPLPSPLIADVYAASFRRSTHNCTTHGVEHSHKNIDFRHFGVLVLARRCTW